ncbi:MAG: hypothetical protein Q9167_006087 [Letrouitia subvulpina]
MKVVHYLLSLILHVLPILASPTPDQGSALKKRDSCAIYTPGTLVATASGSFFKSCPGGTVNWALQQSDANFVIYGPGAAVLWTANTGGHKSGCVPGNPNSCRIDYQSDGNLVEYYNGKSIWQSGTSGHDHSTLYFSNTRPFMYIVNANQQIIWSTGF